ncbi:flavodoxin [bacterium]|nr:flavodoxin [bacterium]
MVLYFSGTGNSRYVAQIIARVTGDRLVSMNELIKTNSKEIPKSDKPLVFVVPTYGWRIPRIVEKFIEEIKYDGNRQTYFVLTCGAQAFNAASYVKKLCNENGLDFQGFAAVRMPENYIAIFTPPDKAIGEKQVQEAKPKIFAIAEEIKNGKIMKDDRSTPLGAVMSGIVNVAFYPLFIKAKAFYATDKCVSCAKCVDLCPLNNVVMSKGKPKWGDNCTHCMACISRCPEEAIEYGNKTQKKPRYYNPGYEE